MPGESTNITSIWSPNKGFDSSWAAGGMTSNMPKTAPSASPWMISNPKYDPNNPSAAPQTIADPGATAKPTLYNDTNGSGTQGVVNPFGLVWNGSQNTGFVPGANPQNNASAPNPNPFAPVSAPSGGNMSQTQQPTNNFLPNVPGQQVMPDGTWFDPNSINPTDNSGSNNSSLDYSGTSQSNRLRGGIVQSDSVPVGSGNTTFSDAGNALPGNNNSRFTTNQTNTGPSGWKVNPDGSWFDPNVQTAQTPTATPATPQTTSTTTPNPTTSPFKPSYLNGVTSGSLDQNGNQQQSPTNPSQFADPATAAWVANVLGGKASGTNISGPGMGFSQPMQMINGNINAGLAADTLQKYGSTPGSYGRYLLARDQGQTGGSSFDSWASGQPGYNPGTRNTGNYDTAGNNPSFQQNPQNFAQQPNSGLAQPPQGQTPQTAGLYNNIYSQLAPILSLLQLLSMGGNFGGQQQQQYQQPPPLNMNSMYGFPFYSRFG